MFAAQLLLSPMGRMKRLNYVLLSGFIGAMNFGLLVLVGLRSGASITEILEGGPLFLFAAAPVPAMVCALGMWIQVCFVFKRSRDFSGSTLTGWLFVALWAAPYIAPQLMVGGENATSFGMAKFASAVPAAIVGLILFFAESREFFSTDAAHARGVDKNASDKGLGALDDATDLVARAEALRAIEAPTLASPEPVISPKPAPAVQGFGRRKSFAGNPRH